MSIDSELLKMHDCPKLHQATLVLAFSGWMDGGDVSTGTVRHLAALLHARPVAEIDAEPFYIYSAPGPMEVAALYRPHVEVHDGLIRKIELPSNTFYCHPAANLLLFLGKEPHLRCARSENAFSRSCGGRTCVASFSLVRSAARSLTPDCRGCT